MPNAPAKHQPKRIAGCARHGAQRYEAERRAKDAKLATAKGIRNSGRWVKARRWARAQAPLCGDPFGHHRRFGELVLAAEVDHITPLVDRPDLAFDPANLMPLCRSCHAEKTAAERKSADATSPAA